MPVAAVRYAAPGSIPADLTRYAALVYPTGSRVPGEVARLDGGLYLPSEASPSDRRRVGVVPYLPGDSIPADLRRVIVTRPGGSSLRAAVLALSPLSFWLLDEASGTTANDLGSANVDGTYTGSPTLGVAGPAVAEQDGTSSTAATFPDAAKYADLGSTAAYAALTALTVLAFVKSSSTGRRMLIGNGPDADPFQFSIGGGGQNNDKVWFEGFIGGSYRSFVGTSSVPRDGYWHFVGGRWRASDGAWSVWLDNAAAGSGTQAGASLGSGAKDVRIGVGGGAWDVSAAGSLAAVAVFGASLTDAQMRGIFAAAFGR